jgi:60 kDa SS-A/Ro ribonucleoprotein
VVPTGKKFCLAVDVSGSMRQPVIGASSIEARDASAAMMLLTAKTEKEFEVVAFSEGLTELNVGIEANNVHHKWICGVGDAKTITDHPDHNQSHFRIFCVFSVLL